MVTNLVEHFVGELGIVVADCDIGIRREDLDVRYFVDIADQRPADARVVRIATVKAGTDQIGPVARVVPLDEFIEIIGFDVHPDHVQERQHVGSPFLLIRYRYGAFGTSISRDG